MRTVKVGAAKTYVGSNLQPCEELTNTQCEKKNFFFRKIHRVMPTWIPHFSDVFLEGQQFEHERKKHAVQESGVTCLSRGDDDSSCSKLSYSRKNELSALRVWPRTGSRKSHVCVCACVRARVCNTCGRSSLLRLRTPVSDLPQTHD